MRRSFRVPALVLAVTVVACTPSSGDRVQLLVSAAASLTDAFGAIEQAFEAAHPDVDVVLNFGGSSALRQQITEGAPVDVFASADPSNMAQLAEAGEIQGSPAVFARNSLQIAVPAGNPEGVEGLEDFADDSLLIGLCAAEVPCGDLARRVLAGAGVVPSPDTYEPDVRALLGKIAEGELDAGMVYVTDVVASGSAVQGIELPVQVDVAAEYPIAILSGASSPGVAADFVDAVLSERGQEILGRYGFASP